MEDVQLTVRVPGVLAEALKKIAVDEKRSLTKQIELLLEHAVKEAETRAAAGGGR